MDYEKLHNETLAKLQRLVWDYKITEETARFICADFVALSEEERIKKELLEFLDYSGDNGYMREEDYINEPLWRRYLEKTQWKPSERMMDALEHAVNRTDSIEVQGALYDLQQELNKLV